MGNSTIWPTLTREILRFDIILEIVRFASFMSFRLILTKEIVRFEMSPHKLYIGTFRVPKYRRLVLRVVIYV